MRYRPRPAISRFLQRDGTHAIAQISARPSRSGHRDAKGFDAALMTLGRVGPIIASASSGRCLPMGWR